MGHGHCNSIQKKVITVNKQNNWTITEHSNGRGYSSMLKIIKAQSKRQDFMTFYAAVSIFYFFYDISGFNLNFMIFYDFMPSGTP